MTRKRSYSAAQNIARYGDLKSSSGSADYELVGSIATLRGKSLMLAFVLSPIIVPRMMTMLSMTYDHRIVDGADADRFFGDVKGNLAASSRVHAMAAGRTPGASTRPCARPGGPTRRTPGAGRSRRPRALHRLDVW